MTKKTQNWLIALVVLALPFLVFISFFISDMAAPPPLPPLPNPNGYDDFIKAAKTVRSDVWDYDKMNEAQLQALVSANAAALSAARAGFSNQCAVPIQFTEAYLNNDINDLALLKRLAAAFAAEGKLAEMENRPADAAKSYLDTFHFGSESMRGGVLIDGLVGIAIQAIATSHLTSLVDQLDAKSCRETAMALETLDSQSPSWTEILQGEHVWQKGYAHLQKIPDSELKTMEPSIQKDDQAVELKFDADIRKTRQLVIRLAARAYELDKGKPPATVSDLVPDYLKAVPKDPATGQDLNLN
ncbi:MAG TPA: hypothetical protein VMB22_06175 [Verrucomicrobiae bacterium]|nr:hypothetical protein [Verrucomicrobiae bacterium]